MKRELAALEEERAAVASFPTATWQRPVQARVLADPTCVVAFRLLRLEERWRQVKFYVQAVEDVLACLDVEKRRLVEMRFFDGLPQWRVIEVLGISDSTFFRHEKEVLAMLAHRLGL